MLGFAIFPFNKNVVFLDVFSPGCEMQKRFLTSPGCPILWLDFSGQEVQCVL